MPVEVGKHRAPSIPDLDDRSDSRTRNLTVLHLDEDFDPIAQITAEPDEHHDIEQ